MPRRNHKRPHPTGWPGRLLAALPPCKALYPLYLARQLEVREERYASPLLPPAFSGLRVAYASDIHYGALFSQARVRALAETVNALEPDVLLLGGDYGETSQGALEFWELKPGFRARLCVLAALGNHDRTLPEENLPRLLAAMRAEGALPLVNEAYFLRREGKTLAFSSPDDFLNGTPDLEKLARLCREADFSIFFPHNPDILPETYALPPFYSLALCGHTHGGQVTLCRRALISSSRYGSRYLSGWYRENGADILVSGGVGTSRLPVRLGARPQIHLLTLESQAK